MRVSNAGARDSFKIPREGTGGLDFDSQICVFFLHAYNFFHQIQTELEVLSRAEKGGPTFSEKGGLTHLGPAFSTPWKGWRCGVWARHEHESGQGVGPLHLRQVKSVVIQGAAGNQYNKDTEQDGVKAWPVQSQYSSNSFIFKSNWGPDPWDAHFFWLFPSLTCPPALWKAIPRLLLTTDHSCSAVPALTFWFKRHSFFPHAYNFLCQILTEFESFKPEKVVRKRLVRIELL